MHDLPEGPALLALARDVLLNDLLPLLPAEYRLEARLVANCMAIAEREAEADGALAEDICRDLALLYGDETLGRPPPQPSPVATGEGGTRASGRVGAGTDPTWRLAELLGRFARELRIGAFANSPQREARARAILWRLTLARLRLANPRFLAANGFA